MRCVFLGDSDELRDAVDFVLLKPQGLVNVAGFDFEVGGGDIAFYLYFENCEFLLGYALA